MQPSTVLALALVAFTPPAVAQASRHPSSGDRAEATPREPATLSIIAASGTVDLRAPGARPRSARVGDSLSRGDRITVGEDGSAVLALPNGATLALLPGARLTAFENPSGARLSCTTLEAGTARVSSPSSVTRSFALSTDSATLSLGRGDGVVQALAGRFTTRVSTHRGVIRARYAGGEFAVNAGIGISVESGRRSHSHELLAEPVWSVAPPTEVVTPGEPVEVSGVYARSRPQRVWRWRTELARDEAFREIIAVQRATRSETLWRGHALAAGTYFVRVIALDVDLYESAPSSVARVTVRGPEVDAGARGRLATVSVPPGLLCGLDGAALHVARAPMRLAPARDHRLRCATSLDGADAREVVIPATQSGDVRHDVQVRVTNFGEGILTVRLRDAEGYGIPYANIEMAGDGVSALPLRESEERGVYRAAIFWRGANPPPLDLRFTVNGVMTFEERVASAGNTFASISR